MRQIRKCSQDGMRPACNLSRLFCVQAFCNQLLWNRFNALLEEETCEGQAVVQRDKSLANERGHFEQSFIIHCESGLRKVGLDPTCQIVDGQESNVGSIEVIELLKVDGSR